MVTFSRAVFPIVGILVLAWFATTACDPGAGIKYDNQTDVTVNIYLGDGLNDFDFRIPPHSTADVATIKAVWEDVIVIRDDASKQLFREEITWDELERRGFSYVITEQMIQSGRASGTPTPQGR